VPKIKRRGSNSHVQCLSVARVRNKGRQGVPAFQGSRVAQASRFDMNDLEARCC
jgi:hypothetical protein